MKKILIAIALVALLVIPAIRTLHHVATNPTDGEQSATERKQIPVFNFAYLGDAPTPNGKLTMIEFWATWCGPCIDSIPELNKLHAEYAARGLTIIAITEEEREVVQRFKKRRNINYTMAIDTDGKMHEAMRVSSIPYAILVDEQRNILWRGNPAELDEGMLEKYLLPATAASKNSA